MINSKMHYQKANESNNYVPHNRIDVSTSGRLSETTCCMYPRKVLRALAKFFAGFQQLFAVYLTVMKWNFVLAHQYLTEILEMVDTLSKAAGRKHVTGKQLP